MLCKTRGIVLHSIPYNDKYSIIYMYTEAFGRASYLVARSRGKKSSVSKALFMPLSVVEMEVEHLNKRDLHRIRETKLCYPLTDVFCNPVKNILALFLSEILFRVVKETEPDSRLFEYLFESIQLLELSDKGVANFHLVFLMRLSRFLGLYPNLEDYHGGDYFDLQNACFTPLRPQLHSDYIAPEEAARLTRLMRMNYETMHLFAMSRMERARCLTIMNEYYRLHLPDFPVLKSLEVLKELFD